MPDMESQRVVRGSSEAVGTMKVLESSLVAVGAMRSGWSSLVAVGTVRVHCSGVVEAICVWILYGCARSPGVGLGIECSLLRLFACRHRIRFNLINLRIKCNKLCKYKL